MHLLSLILVVGLSATALAQQDGPVFFEETSERAQKILMEFEPPPADASPADSADLQISRDWVKKRTPEQCTQAIKQRHLDFGSIWKSEFARLSKSQMEEIEKFYYDVFGATDFFVNTIKVQYRRQRPFQRDSEVKLCFGLESHPSAAYPSGHATISMTFARIMAALFPEKSKKILEVGANVAMNRVIGGVHHLSDVVAGDRLSLRVLALFKESPVFQDRVNGLADLLRKKRIDFTEGNRSFEGVVVVGAAADGK